MKTFDRKDIYSWSNAEKAKQYIRKEGYFADDLDELQKDINANSVFTLNEIKTDTAMCFIYDEGDLYAPLFLPADKVKEIKEKKWRAFKDHNEFITETQLTVGDLITIHDKTIDHDYYTMITSLDNGGIVLGGFILSSFEMLLKNYEWLDKDGKWQRFGVEE